MSAELSYCPLLGAVSMGFHVLESVSNQVLKRVGRGLSTNLFTACIGAS